MADDDDENEEVNKEEELQQEAPIPVSKKPFVAKKFRDALRRNDYITGKPRNIKLKHSNILASIQSQLLILFQKSESSCKRRNQMQQ